MTMPKVSAEASARFQALMNRAAGAAFVLSNSKGDPRLILMDLTDEVAEAAIREARAAGYSRCAGVVALMRAGSLESESVDDDTCKRAVHIAVNLFAIMCAENVAA